MGATVGPVDTERFASDLEGLWGKFNNLDPEALLSAGVGGGGGTSSGGSSGRQDEKADQEATGFLLDLVSVSEANGLKLPRGELCFCCCCCFAAINAADPVEHGMLPPQLLSIAVVITGVHRNAISTPFRRLPRGVVKSRSVLFFLRWTKARKKLYDVLLRYF